MNLIVIGIVCIGLGLWEYVSTGKKPNAAPPPENKPPADPVKKLTDPIVDGKTV